MKADWFKFLLDVVERRYYIKGKKEEVQEVVENLTSELKTNEALLSDVADALHSLECVFNEIITLLQPQIFDRTHQNAWWYIENAVKFLCASLNPHLYKPIKNANDRVFMYKPIQDNYILLAKITEDNYREEEDDDETN